MKYTAFMIVMIIMAGLLTGCATPKANTLDVNTIGSTPLQLNEVSVEHGKSVDIISAEVVGIAKICTNKVILAKTDTIAEEVIKLRPITKLIHSEAKAKQVLLDDHNELVEVNRELRAKLNSAFNKLTNLFKFIGLVAIPLGLVLAFKFGKDFFIVTVFGVLAIISASVSKLLEQYGLVLAIITVLIITYVAIRMYFVQSRTIVEAVQVGEALKSIVKTKAPKELNKLFGEGVVPGTIKQDPVTEKIILGARKQVLRKAAPTAGK